MSFPKKIAFVHIPRTAGVFLMHNLLPELRKNEYKILNSWNNLRRDWTKEELLSFLNIKNQSMFVHNHLSNWDAESIKKYKKNGWFTFSFIRHPGDRLCSAYFRFNIKERFNESLTGFINHALSKGFPKGTEKSIPPYWKDIDFIKEANSKNINYFLKKYFNHNYKSRKPLNTSSNKGYEYYCKTNQISKTTQKLIKNSEEYLIYLKISKKNKLEYYFIILKKLIQKKFNTLFPKKPL